MRPILILSTAMLSLVAPLAVGVESDSAPVPISGTHRAMGTEFSITIYSRDRDPNPGYGMLLLNEIFDEIDRIEALITTWNDDSQVAYLNRDAARSPVKVAPEVVQLLQACATAARDTGGAFDPTVGPLSRLYGLYESQSRQPSPEEITAALANVGMAHVKIDAAASNVFFDRPGVELDFGAIGKGYAVDRAVEILKKYRFLRALIDAGTSTIYALGAPPGADGWTVRVRHPYNPDDVVAEVVLKDASLSTSGCYDLDVVDGVPICNIFDPRTGLPRRGMLSATVIAPTATQTDALSTGFLVMGVEEARAFCKKHPEVSAIMVPEPSGTDPAPVWIGEHASPPEHGSTQ